MKPVVDAFADLAGRFEATPEGLRALVESAAFQARFPHAIPKTVHIDLGHGLRAELTASDGWTVRAIAEPALCPCCRRPATRTQPCPSCGAPV